MSFVDFLWVLMSYDGDAHPPLPMTNERKIKIESPPLRLSVSQMKPIVTGVVGHSKEQSYGMERIFLFSTFHFVLTSNDCSCEKWMITKKHKTNEKRQSEKVLKDWWRPIWTSACLLQYFSSFSLKSFVETVWLECESWEQQNEDMYNDYFCCF